MKRTSIYYRILALVFCMLIFGSSVNSFAIDESNNQNNDEVQYVQGATRKTYCYEVTVIAFSGGYFYYSIPDPVFSDHYGYWYVEFAGTNIHDQYIDSKYGSLYAPNAVNIYFYYLA